MEQLHVHRSLRWLVVAIAADGLVALALLAHGAGALGQRPGQRGSSLAIALSALGLACVALLVVLAVRASRAVRVLERRLTDADRRLAATAGNLSAEPAAHAPPPPLIEVPPARRRVARLLEEGNLTLALQPIIDLDKDRWVAVEALARFPDGRAADLWFREAHDAGLGVELELLCVTRALRLVSRLPAGIGLSVNASPSLILDPRLSQAINDSGVVLTRLTLEITEHAAVTEYDDIKAALLGLRERGVRLAVDDTGAGYASFNHVLRLRPDIIKLDQSLVVGIADDPARRAFVTAIVLLALELDATVTAEGVQSSDDLTTVAALGVDQAQGYHVGRPDVGAATWATWSHRRWMRHSAPDAIELFHSV
ncbi:MAG: hypothetical protein QOE19_4042 [Actinomycetota bacterium]|nr:hypothetical protein [Actinomycetota bacterium]